MQRPRFHWLYLGFLSVLPLLGFLPQQTLAQVEGRVEGSDHSDFLLTGANCVVSGDNSNYSRIFDRTESVPINRQVYTSHFAVEAAEYSNLSCGVDPVEFGTLDLQIGVNDNKTARDSRMTVNIYQGSNLKYRYDNVRGGTLINVLLTLDGAEVSGGQSNFSIEMSNCQGRGPCRLEFTKAQLLPSSGFTSSGSISSPSTSTMPIDSGTPQESTSSRQDAANNDSNSSRQDSSSGSGGGVGERITEGIGDAVGDAIGDALENLF